jgi:hypothetical protein
MDGVSPSLEVGAWIELEKFDPNAMLEVKSGLCA